MSNPTTSVRPSRAHRPLQPMLFILVLALGATLLLGLSFGSARIPIAEVWSILLAEIAPGLVTDDFSAMRSAIVLESRYPECCSAWWWVPVWPWPARLPKR